MKLTRGVVVWLLIVLLLGVVGPVSAAKKVTLSMWGFITPPWIETYREFERQHPNIKIKESLISQEWASSSEKFLAAMAAGNAPDVSIQNSHQFTQWASQGPFLNIAPFAERDGMRPEDWYPGQWDGTFFSGKQYALPGITDTRMLYWNKDLFAEVGLDPEVPPATWDDLEIYTSKLVKKDANGKITQYGFIPYFGNTWTWLYGWLNGAKFLDETGRTVTCDSPEVEYALQWMVDFYDEYCGGAQTAASFLQGFQGAAQDPFVNGRLAMVGNGNWMLWNFATMPDLNYGQAPMPVPNTSTAEQST